MARPCMGPVLSWFVRAGQLIAQHSSSKKGYTLIPGVGTHGWIRLTSTGVISSQIRVDHS